MTPYALLCQYPWHARNVHFRRSITGNLACVEQLSNVYCERRAISFTQSLCYYSNVSPSHRGSTPLLFFFGPECLAKKRLVFEIIALCILLAHRHYIESLIRRLPDKDIALEDTFTRIRKDMQTRSSPPVEYSVACSALPFCLNPSEGGIIFH